MRDMIQLKELGEIERSNLDPRRFPHTTFDLFSIPAYDNGMTPEVCEGNSIGSSKTVVAPNDVLFSKLNPRIPRVWLVPENSDNKQICSTEFLPFRLKDVSKAEPEYLRFMFLSPQFLRPIQAAVNSSTRSHQRVKPAVVLDQSIPLPPVNEQRRIVNRIKECLSRVDEIKRLRGDAQQEAGALIKARRHELWSDLTRNESNLVPFGSIVQSFKNGLYKPAKFYGHGNLFVRMFNINDGSFVSSRFERVEVDADEQEKYAIAPGDLLISRVNSRELVGKSAIAPELPEPAVFEAMLIRVRVDEKKALPDFVVEMLNSPECLANLRAKAKHAIGQSSLNQQDISSTGVPLPDLQIQKQLAKEFAALHQLSEGLKREMLESSEESRLLTQAVLRKAFAGEL